MSTEGGRTPQQITSSAARIWDNPMTVLQIEKQRYPYQRALSKLIGGVFREHVTQGARILEVGAGLGFLKDLVPAEYHVNYISSDYSSNNIGAGRRTRELKAIAASATELPFPDNSLDVVVNMDAYDTLPDLQSAINEAQRVLRPGGTFIHVQVNRPDDNVVRLDYPGMIFFPTGFGKLKIAQMTGVRLTDVLHGLNTLEDPEAKVFQKVLASFLNPRTYHEYLKSPDIGDLSDMLNIILNAIPVDKLRIPNMFEYLKQKLERTAKQSGLQVVESIYRGTSVVAPPTAEQSHSEANSFQITNGVTYRNENAIITATESSNVIESADSLVFVAKKGRD